MHHAAATSLRLLWLAPNARAEAQRLGRKSNGYEKRVSLPAGDAGNARPDATCAMHDSRSLSVTELAAASMAAFERSLPFGSSSSTSTTLPPSPGCAADHLSKHARNASRFALMTSVVEASRSDAPAWRGSALVTARPASGGSLPVVVMGGGGAASALDDAVAVAEGAADAAAVPVGGGVAVVEALEHAARHASGTREARHETRAARGSDFTAAHASKAFAPTPRRRAGALLAGRA